MKRFRMKAYLLLTLLLTAYILPGCGGDAGNGHWDKPTVIPTILSTSPAPAALGVPIGNNLTVTFNEAMDPATLASPATSFTVKEYLSNAPVSGVVTASGNTATFNPDADLLPLTEYAATITTGAMNLAGKALASDYVWRFTTGATVDTSAPFVSATNISNGAINQPFNTDITATFNEAMDPATLASPATSFTVNEFVSNNPVNGVVTYLGNTATFNPDADLLPLTEYIATVSADAKDLAGLALTSGPVPNPWRWTTGAAADIVAPEITITSPVDGDIDIPVDSTITATFNEEMSQATMIAANFTVVETLSTNPVTGMVVYDVLTNVATFTPLSDLAPSTSYTVTVTDGAQDLASNALVVPAVAGLPVPNPWTFTTAAPPTIIPGATCTVAAGPTIPTVTESNPTDGNLLATTSTAGVANNGKLITANFSMAMNPTTIASATAPLTFTIMETVSLNQVSGTVTMDLTNTVATFTTDTALVENTAYTASITVDALSADGVAIACPYEWNFTTVTPAATGLAPVNMTGIESFGVLGGLSITLGGGPASTTGFRVDGDVGVSPGNTCNGCDSTTVTGVISVADAVAAAAKIALVAAYDDAIGRTVDVCTLATDDLTTGPTAACNLGINGTFQPGLYWSGTNISIPVGGTITLDAMNDPNAVFIFQSESTIITNVNSHIILANLANANNVFWVAKSSATIGGTGADFAGTVLALEDFTVNQDTQMLGRALARNGNVTVQDGALITVPTP